MTIIVFPPAAKKPSDRAKVLYDYEPQNSDELQLKVGQIIRIINKEVFNTEGWWEGELNGSVGVFPDNFVELLPLEEDMQSEKVCFLTPIQLMEYRRSRKVKLQCIIL